MHLILRYGETEQLRLTCQKTVEIMIKQQNKGTIARCFFMVLEKRKIRLFKFRYFLGW
jgi:hypothetical protein